MTGTLLEREHRRRLGVKKVLEGWPCSVVAGVLDVSVRAVQQWVKAYHDGGPDALTRKAMPGRPAKLTPQQERMVLGWFAHSPTEFGFATELWTAPRVAKLIVQKFGVQFHPRYLNQWLAKRRITPQRPSRRPRERDEAEIRRWLQAGLDPHQPKTAA
jgi:transposase